jgi:hypothetical protein
MLKNIFLLSFLSAIFLFSDCKKDSAKKSTSTTDSTSTNTGGNIPTGGTSGSTNLSVLKNMFGINAYEWNFEDANNTNVINETNMALIKSFSCFRHYLDWEKLEHAQGAYTYNPVYEGSWNYDVIYARCKQEGILVLADIKTTPAWLVSTYPTADQDNEDVPAPYGSNHSDPASYLFQGKVAFQFAARYGYNTAVDKSLVSVYTTPRWNGDGINQPLIGMGLIKYVECNNEEDRTWKGPKAQQSPEEYAANMSTFYDGNMGKLGKNVGIKSADPNMIVVMGGLAGNDPSFVSRMVDWCKTNRGYKADGSVNLCFDVINYHCYTGSGGAGIAPELSTAGATADSFVSLANSLPGHPEVWITESGYDINQGSTQRAIPIGNKSALVTQADWILRTSLLYMRHGISKLFFYQLFDDTPNSAGTFATSGLVDGNGRRPAADYFLQTTALMGNYSYVKTLSADPLVDQYQSGTKTMYVLTIPDQKGRTGTYTLTTANNNPLTLYTLKVGASAMTSTQVTPVNNKLTISVSETPVFVGN